MMLQIVRRRRQLAPARFQRIVVWFLGASSMCLKSCGSGFTLASAVSLVTGGHVQHSCRQLGDQEVPTE